MLYEDVKERIRNFQGRRDTRKDRPSRVELYVAFEG